MSFLEDIGLVNPPGVPTSTTEIDNLQKKKKSPAKHYEMIPKKEYKFGLVNLYVHAEDRDLAKHLAKELKIPMKVLIHRLLFAAEIAIPNETKVTVLNGKAFWEMFDVMKGDDKNDTRK